MHASSSRRAILAGGLAVSAAAFTGPSLARAPRPFFGPGGETLGLQIYTLGDEGQKNIEAACEAVRAIGYRAVELLAWGPNSPAVLKAALTRSGLIARSTQFNFMAMKDLDKLIADANQIGLEYVVASTPPLPSAKYGPPQKGEEITAYLSRLFGMMNSDDWKAYADQLNKLGARLAPHGLKIAHHNHNVEFSPVGETNGYDILQRYTDPSSVFFELDVGWVKAAGLDPVDILQRYSGRFRMMHLKDVKPTTKPNFRMEQDPAIVGEGVMDWTKILPAAKAAGVVGYYVEQEPPFAIPRIDAARKNYEYLSTLKV